MSNGPRASRRRNRASTAHGDDLRNDPGFRAFERDVRENLVPQISDSAYVMSLQTGNEPDVKQAVEMGFALLLGKPIIPFLLDGAELPGHLGKIALDVIRCPYPLSDPRAKKHVIAELSRIKAEHPELFDEEP